MAWTLYNSSMGSYPLFGQADQCTEYLNYNHELFGYSPSALILENTPPFITGDSLYDSLVQCPQTDRHARMGSGEADSHRINSSTMNYPSIKLNKPKVSVIDGVTEPNAICPHSMPSTPTTDSKGEISNHSQVVKHKAPRASNQRGKFE